VAGIRITGMASGLPPNIVEQIMDAERIPVKNMQTQKSKQEDKLKLVTELETKINDVTKNIGELTSTRGFMDNQLISGDPSVVGGVVDGANAVTGSWGIEVLQLAQKPGAVSNGFPDRDRTQMGTGYIKFETPQGMKQVYVNSSNSTLDGVAKAINTSGSGLRATVINDRRDKGAPFRLLVTGLTTGDDQQVSFPTIYLLDGDQDMYFDQNRPAQNAKIKLDGFEMEVPENKLKDIVPGVTLDLKKAAPGQEVQVSVKENQEVISGKIKSFVDSYNAVLSFIQTQNKMNEKTDTSRTLGGDGLLRSIESDMRRVILDPQYGVGSSINRVAQIGIEFNRNGTLNFNADKFNAALSADPQAVASFLRGDGFSIGFVPTVKRQVSNLLATNFGVIANRKRGLTEKIDNMNKRIEGKERLLTVKEDQLRRKFGDLETKMSKMQQQMASVGAMAGSVGMKS
jgi:flagellar hook-associated protein 2